MGFSCASGKLIFGIVGDHKHLEYTIIGDVVNMAAKIEAYTKEKSFKVCMTEKAYNLALNQGTYQTKLNLDHSQNITFQEQRNLLI